MTINLALLERQPKRSLVSLDFIDEEYANECLQSLESFTTKPGVDYSENPERPDGRQKPRRMPASPWREWQPERPA